MIFDFGKMLGLMKEKGYTQTSMARVLGITPAAFNRKVKCKSYFTQPELKALMLTLEITDPNEYLFKLKS